MDRRRVSKEEEEEGIPPRGSYRYYIVSAGDRRIAAIARSDQLGNTSTHARTGDVVRSVVIYAYVQRNGARLLILEIITRDDTTRYI